MSFDLTFFGSLNLKWKGGSIIKPPLLNGNPSFHSAQALWSKQVWWKSPRILFFFLSERGSCVGFDLSENCFVCSLYCAFFSSSFFSCIRVSDCPGKVTQSALLTCKRAFMGLRDFSGNYSLKNSRWAAEKVLTAVIKMIFFLLRDKINTLNHMFHSSDLVMLFNTKTTLIFLGSKVNQ